MSETNKVIDELESTSKNIGRFSNLLLIAGAGLDGYNSYQNYYDRTHDVAGAITPGILHATLSTAGTWAFAFIGEELGGGAGLLLSGGNPLGGIVGSVVGGAAGGFGGSLLGDKTADDLTPIIAPAVSHAVSGFGNWISSHF